MTTTTKIMTTTTTTVMIMIMMMMKERTQYKKALGYARVTNLHCLVAHGPEPLLTFRCDIRPRPFKYWNAIKHKLSQELQTKPFQSLGEANIMDLGIINTTMNAFHSDLGWCNAQCTKLPSRTAPLAQPIINAQTKDRIEASDAIEWIRNG